MSIRYLRTTSLKELVELIPQNLEKYASEGFGGYGLDSDTWSFESKSSDVNIAELKTLILPKNDNFFEAENSEIVFGAFSSLTRYQAADPRLWSYYTHLDGLEYVRARYPKRFDLSDKVTLAKSIQSHVFAASQSRYLMRNNALARLWWNARVAFDVSSKNASDILKVLTLNTDFRATIIERPTQSTSNAYKAAILYSVDKYSQDEHSSYFIAPRSGSASSSKVTHYNYRHVLKLLNCLGGSLNFSYLNPQEIIEYIKKDEDEFLNNLS